MLATMAMSACSTAALAGEDAHEMCQSWAESGECTANPGYMQQTCPVACVDASKYKSQMTKECEGYARMGECGRNPAFMLSTCRKQCEDWEASKGGAVRIDRRAECVEWSILGRCADNVERMGRECNTSCTIAQRCAQSTFTGWSVGLCDKALRCESEDKKSNCEALAARGKCREDATYMVQNCLQTCAALDVDAVLSAQRAEFRAILSPLIDIPGEMSRRQERCWLPGWSGHNHYKQMLPTQCAAPRRLPWQRQRVPRARITAKAEDQATCPVNVKTQTPRVPYRTRNVTLLPHTPHTVRVQQVLASPRVRLLHDFITAEEAEEIIRKAQPLFGRSPVRSVATDRRTSSTATLGGVGNWAVRSIRERISAFSGYEDRHLEPLQVVRYHPGEKYDPHHDSFDICDFPQKPRRHLTFLIYLNDMPEEAGGWTTFPRLNVRVQPTARTALVFNDVLDSGHDDERTEHGGSAPSTGIKYAINCWIRARPETSISSGLGRMLGGMV